MKTAWEKSPCEPHEVQQGQVQGPVPGSGQSQAQVQVWQRIAWEQPQGEGSRSVYWWKIQCKLEMCACSSACQLYPGLHQEKHDQQIEGGDSALLLCSHVTLPEVLHSALRLSTQEGYWTVGEGPEEGCEDDHRAGAPLLWRWAERAVFVSCCVFKALFSPEQSEQPRVP